MERDGDVDDGSSGLLAPDGGDEQRTGDEELGQPDGGHGQDETRRAEEPPDDGQLDDASEQDGADETDRHGEEVVHSAVHDERHGQHGRGEAELDLGEIQNPVGPVHQRHADGDQRSQ